jgi:hypothetical protein
MLMTKLRDKRGAMSNALVAVVIILLIVVVVLQWLSLRAVNKAGGSALTVTEQAGKTAGDLGIGGPTTTKPAPGAAAVAKEAGAEAKEVVKQTAESAGKAVGKEGK